MGQLLDPEVSLSEALAKAECILSAGPAHQIAHVSVACRPGGGVVQLLSPPGRGVPPGLWDALDESEAALSDDHRKRNLDVGAQSDGSAEVAQSSYDGEGLVGGKRQAEQPSSPESAARRSKLSKDSPEHADRPLRAHVDDAGERVLDGYQTAGAVPRASQVSEHEGASECHESSQADPSSQSGVQFLDEAHAVLVPPSIPPEDPYLLKDDSLSPAARNRLRVFYVPPRDSRRDGAQAPSPRPPAPPRASPRRARLACPALRRPARGP